MAIKIKHTDPTLNEFSTKDLVVNVQSGSLFFKSNTDLFKVQGDNLSSDKISGSITSFDGVLGIGTSTPTLSTETYSSTTQPPVGVQINTNTEAIRILSSVGGNTHIGYDNSSTNRGNYFSYAKTGNTYFRTYDGSTYSTKLYISGSGKVGIGTTSPTAKLDVDGEISIGGGETVDEARLTFRASDESKRFTIETDLDNTTSNDLLGFRGTSTDNILVLKGDGKVGINTSTPTGGDDTTVYPTKLTVNGMISSSRGFNIASHVASGDRAVGYYTIATCHTGRAVGRFIIEDRDSSRHLGTVFYASSFFGGSNTNDKKHHINVISAGTYSTQTVTKIRIKAGGVYDGKVLQVYVANASNSLRVRFLGDAAQTNGWRLKNFIPDATPPPAGTLSYSGDSNVSGSSTYANITAANGVEFNLDTAGKTTGTTGDFQINGDLNVDGTITKGAGSFRIDHPNPIKTDTHYLYHNFVESPTEGDNIYRWTITTINNTHTIDLPDYYKFLNKNDMVWVNAVDHFGRAYGTINNEQTKLTITSDTDGKYNVLLIGTRKDQFIKDNYKGVEVKK